MCPLVSLDMLDASATRGEEDHVSNTDMITATELDKHKQQHWAELARLT